MTNSQAKPVPAEDVPPPTVEELIRTLARLGYDENGVCLKCGHDRCDCAAPTPLPVDLPAEILELRDALRQSERDALIELWGAAKIMCESLPIYSASSSAFQRKQRLDAALGRVTQILGACV